MIGVELQVIVPGLPVTKGSLKCVGRNGSHRIVDDNPHASEWRAAIVSAIHDAALPAAEPHEAVGVEITSTLTRPRHHYGARGIRPNAPKLPTAARTGDVDKLARLVLDALADAEVLVDDAQVVEVVSRKAYPLEPTAPNWLPDVRDEPGVVIRVYPME